MSQLVVPDFREGTALVVGDAMLDRYWYGETSRVSPEAPVPIVRVDSDADRPGGAANVAANLAALGVRVVLLSFVGEDTEGDRLEQLLEMAGVESHLERVPDMRTTTKLRIVSHRQQLIRVDFESTVPPQSAKSLIEKTASLVDDISVVVCSDYGKGALLDVFRLIQWAHSMNHLVVVDPKGVDFRKYRGASLLTPNQSELEGAVGSCGGRSLLEDRGSRLLKELDLQALLVTKGERGMALYRNGEPVVEYPTRAREVYDVTGAGDTVVAVVAAALSVGVELDRAVRIANVAAGLSVAKFGTTVVTRSEIQAAIWAEHGNRVVVDEDELFAFVANARSRGERVIMTNGCFDILHQGHVTYLTQAKTLGDRLIVAVNDDDSVYRLKGRGRPVNTLEHRMAVLAALQCVDWVIPFSEDTPERLICRMRPDILVKGGDYRPEDIPGYGCVVGKGGEVRVLDYVEGLSTTRIITRIGEGHS